MAIYGRFGHALTIEREATIDDIRPMTGSKPDAQDRKALENRSYWIVKYADDKAPPRPDGLDLYHLGYLRADGGIKEIYDRLHEIDPNGGWQS